MNPKIRDLFFKNLLLLGFDKSHYGKICRTCDKDMFVVPNQKMFEIVTYFLFSKLKGDYPLPWPLLDKTHLKEFQRLTFTYLSNISKESAIPFPRFTLSVISTAGKDRFYELYFAFSCFVLEKCIRSKDNVELLNFPKKPSSDFQDLLKQETILSTERTQHLVRFSKKYMEELLKCSSDFCSLISSLKSSYLTKKAALEEQTKQFCSLHSKNEDNSSQITLFKKHFSHLKKVMEDWRSIQEFLAKEEKLWKYLCSEVKEDNVRYVLDSTHVDVSVLESLVNEHTGNIDDVETQKEDGKPCLIRFLKLFAVLLRFLLQTYLTGKSSHLLDHCKLENSWCLDESQEGIISLNNKIHKCLSDIQKSTETFQEEILAGEYSEEMENFIKEVQKWAFCSKSFHDKIKSTRSNTSLPSKGGVSFLLTEASMEQNQSNLSEEDVVFEATSPQDVQPQLQGDLTLDFDFGFNDSKNRLSCLSNVSLLNVSLPEDDDI